MIISHEHKFIFLKTKKTAGTSIELALSKLCGPDDVIAPLTANDEALRAGGRAELAAARLVVEPASVLETPLLGLKLDAAIPTAKTTFRPSDTPYRKYYDRDTRAIVGHWYQREIKLFGYTF